MSPEIYHLPASLYVVCMASSMAFIMCTIEWLLCVRNAEDGYHKAIWSGQYKAFFFVVILSLVINLLDHVIGGHALKIRGELVIIVSTYGLLSLRNRDQVSRVVICFSKRVLKVGLYCFFGWLLMFGLYYALLNLVMVFTGAHQAEVVGAVVFVVGGSACAFIGYLYLRMQANEERNAYLAPYSPQTFVVTLLLAFIVLLVPLMIQETINSEDWQKGMRQTAVRRI